MKKCETPYCEGELGDRSKNKHCDNCRTRDKRLLKRKPEYVRMRHRQLQSWDYTVLQHLPKSERERPPLYLARRNGADTPMRKRA